MKNTANIISPASGSGALPSDTMLVTLSGALLLVLIIILAMLWASRRTGFMQRINRAGSIHIVSTRSLGGRERLVLVETGGRLLLLGVTTGQITCLDAGVKPMHTEDTTSEPSSFSTVLKSILQRCPREKI